MKYAVDKITDNIVTLENLETKEIKEIEIEKLPEGIKEGNIIIEESIYKIDYEEEKIRRAMLRAKLNRLKRLKDDNND